MNNPYDEQPGIALKGDNLARMLALRSGANMQNVERLADDLIMYGLLRFGKSFDLLFAGRHACLSLQMNVIKKMNVIVVVRRNFITIIIINTSSVLPIDCCRTSDWIWLP